MKRIGSKIFYVVLNIVPSVISKKDVYVLSPIFMSSTVKTSILTKNTIFNLLWMLYIRITIHRFHKCGLFIFNIYLWKLWATLLLWCYKNTRRKGKNCRNITQLSKYDTSQQKLGCHYLCLLDLLKYAKVILIEFV